MLDQRRSFLYYSAFIEKNYNGLFSAQIPSDYRSGQVKSETDMVQGGFEHTAIAILSAVPGELW